MDHLERTVAFYTLGCKLNFSETSTIARQLLEQGYNKVPFEKAADIYIINTCSVTDNADKECKSIVKKALNINPKALICVIGCYAQLKPNEIAQIEGVDLVLGAKEKFNINQYLQSIKKNSGKHIHSCEIGETNHFINSYSIGDRTRAFLKVQDGCDYKCTYCTIPLARGISRSSTLENVLNQAKEISKKGIKEIVLTGVNIGDYGKGELGNKTHQHTFIELIKELDKISDIKRIRISSIEPNLLKDEIIEFISISKKFVPHFHIPLQSGSDEILKRMRRRYLTSLYENRVKKIRELVPDACIGADVIVGFPGETEEKFLETYNFLNLLNVNYLHVFTYSERDDTEAVRMNGAVPFSERKKRNKLLKILSEKKKQNFYESQLGKEKTVLWECENKNGKMFGYTENYLRVSKKFNNDSSNRLELIKLQNIDLLGNITI